MSTMPTFPTPRSPLLYCDRGRRGMGLTRSATRHPSLKARGATGCPLTSVPQRRNFGLLEKLSLKSDSAAKPDATPPVTGQYESHTDGGGGGGGGGEQNVRPDFTEGKKKDVDGSRGSDFFNIPYGWRPGEAPSTDVTIDPMDEVYMNRPRVPTLADYQRPSGAPNPEDLHKADFEKFMQGDRIRFSKEIKAWSVAIITLIWCVISARIAYVVLQPPDFSWVDQERARLEAAQEKMKNLIAARDAKNDTLHTKTAEEKGGVAK